MRLEDGAGSGVSAKVNSSRQLETAAVATSKIHEISNGIGEAYIFTTAGFLAITSTGTEHGCFYMKNNSSKNLFIHSIRSCGSQVQKVKIYKDITAGTLLTDETAGGNGNLSQVSSSIADVSVYKGGNGKTVTGTLGGQHINGIGHSDEKFDGAMILGQDDSIAISCEMAIAGDFCIRVLAYFEE